MGAQRLVRYRGRVNFITMDPKIYDLTLGAAFAETAIERGWSIRRVAVFARLRPRRVRRVFAGKASAGPVEVKRLTAVLQLDWAVLEESVYVDAAVAQLAAETEARESEARSRAHL